MLVVGSLAAFALGHRLGFDTDGLVRGLEAFTGSGRRMEPKGEAAGRLWDGVLLVAGTPGFYELKRSREKGPDFS